MNLGSKPSEQNGLEAVLWQEAGGAKNGKMVAPHLGLEHWNS